MLCDALLDGQRCHVCPVLLRDQHRDELATTGQDRRQGCGFGVGEGARLRPNPLGEQREERRVEGVGLSQAAGGAGEVAYLARIDDRHRDAGCGQGSRARRLVAARRFEHDERRAERGDPSDERVDAVGVVGGAPDLGAWKNGHVKRGLRDVDADEEGGEDGYVHGDASITRLPSGLA